MPGREPHPDDGPYIPWGPKHPDWPNRPQPQQLAKAKKKKQFRNDPTTSANA